MKWEQTVINLREVLHERSILLTQQQARNESKLALASLGGNAFVSSMVGGVAGSGGAGIIIPDPKDPVCPGEKCRRSIKIEFSLKLRVFTREPSRRFINSYNLRARFIPLTNTIRNMNQVRRRITEFLNIIKDAPEGFVSQVTGSTAIPSATDFSVQPSTGRLVFGRPLATSRALAIINLINARLTRTDISFRTILVYGESLSASATTQPRRALGQRLVFKPEFRLKFSLRIPKERIVQNEAKYKRHRKKELNRK